MMAWALVGCCFAGAMLCAFPAKAAGPDNGNQWLVTTADDKALLLTAHEMTVTANGSLVFTVNWGGQILVTEAVPAASYKCVKAVTLTADDHITSYRQSPPYVPGCSGL